MNRRPHRPRRCAWCAGRPRRATHTSRWPPVVAVEDHHGQPRPWSPPTRIPLCDLHAHFARAYGEEYGARVYRRKPTQSGEGTSTFKRLFGAVNLADLEKW